MLSYSIFCVNYFKKLQKVIVKYRLEQGYIDDGQ